MFAIFLHIRSMRVLNLFAFRVSLIKLECPMKKKSGDDDERRRSVCARRTKNAKFLFITAETVVSFSNPIRSNDISVTI